ncbi:hypothetical protein C5F62_07865, partial [Photobacterium damselae subsp. damselae]
SLGHSVSLIKSFRLNHFTSAHTDCMVKLLKNNIFNNLALSLTTEEAANSTQIKLSVNTYFQSTF